MECHFRCMMPTAGCCARCNGITSAFLGPKGESPIVMGNTGVIPILKGEANLFFGNTEKNQVLQAYGSWTSTINGCFSWKDIWFGWSSSAMFDGRMIFLMITGSITNLHTQLMSFLPLSVQISMFLVGQLLLSHVFLEWYSLPIFVLIKGTRGWPLGSSRYYLYLAIWCSILLVNSILLVSGWTLIKYSYPIYNLL